MSFQMELGALKFDIFPSEGVDGAEPSGGVKVSLLPLIDELPLLDL